MPGELPESGWTERSCEGKGRPVPGCLLPDWCVGGDWETNWTVIEWSEGGWASTGFMWHKVKDLVHFMAWILYGYRPGKDVLGEHLVSDETIWVLYENWCKAYNKERNYAEMVCRFDQFKMNAILVHGHNCGFSGRMILGEFADGRERKPLPAEKYLILKEVVSTPAINIHESPSTLN